LWFAEGGDTSGWRSQTAQLLSFAEGGDNLIGFDAALMPSASYHFTRGAQR